MKLEQEKFEVYKSESLQEYKLKLPQDPAGVRIIVELLSSKLYTNKLESSIRETLTNAIDANIEAGNSHLPVDIVCPTQENPFISFRDYGPGMPPEKVIEIYINLAVSTKRETNNLHGGFGIGSIAPFSITSQIELTTYYRGFRYSWVVYKNEEGILAASLLDKRESNEPSGTLVRFAIPNTTHNISLSYSCVFTFQTFSNAKLNIINFHADKAVKKIDYDNGSFVCLATDLNRLGYYKYLVVVVGNVPYLIRTYAFLNDILPDELNNLTYSPHNSPFIPTNFTLEYCIKRCFDEYNGPFHFVVLRAPVGVLELTTSREELVVNDKLTDFIKQEYEKLVRESYDKLKTQVSDLTTEEDKLYAAFSYTSFPFPKSFNIFGKEYTLGESSLKTVQYERSSHLSLKELVSNVYYVSKKEDFSEDKCAKDLYLDNVELSLINNTVTDNLVVKEIIAKSLIVSALIKNRVVLIKTRHNLDRVLKQLDLSDNRSVIIIRVFETSENYNRALDNLESITEVECYPFKTNKQDEDKLVLEKKEKKINLHNLRKEDYVYTLYSGIFYRSSEYKYKELVGQELKSLPESGGLYFIKEGLNQLVYNSRLISLINVINIIGRNKDIPPVYFVNNRVGELIKDDPSWVSVYKWYKEYVDSLLPTDSLFREAIFSYLLLYEGAKKNFKGLINRLKGLEYNNIDDSLLEFLKSENYKTLKTFYSEKLLNDYYDTLKIFDSSSALDSIFKLVFKEDACYFNCVRLLIGDYNFFNNHLDLELKMIVNYINSEKESK